MSVLQDALRRAQDERDRGRGIEPPPRPAPPWPQPPHEPPAKGRSPALPALALAAAIFAVVVVAWHTRPGLSNMPAKWPAPGLKLDTHLDLERKARPAGTP